MQSTLSTIFAVTILLSQALPGEILLPSEALERDAPVEVVYRTRGLATGKGTLSVKWTDVHGRVVEERDIPVELVDEAEVRFTLDLRHAAAMKNDLAVRFSFDGADKSGKPDQRREEAKVSFVARPPDRQWWDYIILMWQNHSPEVFRHLKTLGITAGQYNGKNSTPPAFLLDNDLRWYAENIATDFYAEYHRWFPDRPKTWAFQQAKELYRKDPTSKEAFKRQPSFSDPIWLRKIRERLVASARVHSPYRPVFYSLGDESGIADLAAYWDFDFSDHSLTEMRVWLRERYETLGALNRQWGTTFSSWDSVIPETTNEAMRRTDENYSAWADHKDWMDVSFARALKMGVDAVRSVDPEAYVGIGGAQMPGWGGYDYYRLSRVLTAVEPYDIGNNIEIIRSLNPAVPVVTTSFGAGPWEKHRVWYELLHGNRGLLLWDEKAEYAGPDGALGERGKEAKPYYNEMRSGVATLLMNSVRQADPIAIHYSQASMRTEWMLAQKPKGEAWVTRTSSTERRDSEFLRLRESVCRLIEDLGLQYNFVAYGQIEQGELLKRGYRVLILPRSTSLSLAEAGAIREFVTQGGVLIAEGQPGVFDEHSRKLAQSRLADLFAPGGAGRGKVFSGLGAAGLLDYHQRRLVGKEAETHQLMRRMMDDSGVRTAFAVVDEAGNPVVGVETHQFRNGGVTLVGLLSNPQLRVDELGPPEFKSNQRFEKARSIRLVLPSELHAYDIRRARVLGKRTELAVTLDPYEPALFAFFPAPAAELRLAAPERVARGATAGIGVGIGAGSPAGKHVLHVDVLDPSGNQVPHYSGNLLAPRGRAMKLLPIAHNDSPGKWQIVVRDLLSAQTQKVIVDVY